MAQTDDKTSPEGKKWQKNTSELFTVFLHSPAKNSSRGHSKLSKECVVMTLRLLPCSHAMVWQTDLSWGEKCVKIGFRIPQKQIPRGIWQISRAVGNMKDWKWKRHGNIQVYHHHEYAIFLLIKTQMSIYLKKKMRWSNITYKPAAALHDSCNVPKNPTEQQDSWDSSDHNCPPIASLCSD